MIKKLHIRGYRSLKDATWEPGHLNVVIGPNGSGKSNLLRVLSLLHQSAIGKLKDATVRQGGFNALLWDARASSLAWELDWEIHKVRLSYQLSLRNLGGAYYVEREVLRVDEHNLLERTASDVVLDAEVGIQAATFRKGLPEDEPALQKLAALSNEECAFVLQKCLEDWRIYHDLSVHQQAEIRQAAVARVEKRVAPDGQNLIPVLHTLYTGDREFRKKLDAAMRAAFGPDFEELVFPPAADQRVQLRVRWKPLETERSAADLSDGTIRFLLLIAILANPNPGDLTAVDEPEAGLHPSMFPIIAELAAEAAERTQVVLTTHSAEFLDAFRQEPPTTTVTQWVDGETRISNVDGEELRRWLKEYSLGALFSSGELEQLA